MRSHTERESVQLVFLFISAETVPHIMTTATKRAKEYKSMCHFLWFSSLQSVIASWITSYRGVSSAAVSAPWFACLFVYVLFFSVCMINLLHIYVTKFKCNALQFCTEMLF